ncbi:MAG: hypothetical protein P8Y11_12275, partial [Gemmatimonadales bacterium]
SLEYEAALFARHIFPRREQEKESRWGDRYSINARGYRGDNFVVPKPPGMVRIVVLGGSAAFDIHAAEGDDWPSRVENRLKAVGFDSAEVINAAVPGHASWDSLGRLFSEIWMFEPDYILVYHCWNDLKYFVRLGPERSLLRVYRPKRTEEGAYLVENPFLYDRGWLDRILLHSQLYVRLRERWLLRQMGEVTLEGLAPDSDYARVETDGRSWGRRQFALNLRLLADAAREAGARPVLVTQARLVAASNGPRERERIAYDMVGMNHDRLVRGFAACDEAVFEVAGEKQIDVIDASSALTGNSAYFEDHVHTTGAGSRALAETVALHLGRILSDSDVR